MAAVTIAKTLAKKLGPKTVAKLKNMDTTKAKQFLDKAKDLKDATGTELRRIFGKLPKTTVREKEKFVPGTVQRRGLRRTDKGKLKTQTEGQEGEIARTKKTKQTLTAMDKKGRIKNITNRFGKTIGKGESRVAKRTRKRIAGKTAAGAAAIAALSTVNKKDKAVPSATAKATSKSYTVKKGDTISEIARDKGTTVGKIRDANPQVTNLNKIKPGQSIKIPMPKVKDRKSVYQDLTKAEMKKLTMKRQAGGPLKPIPAGNKGLPNLPKPVRNKMGFMKAGGKIQKRAGGGVALKGFGATRKI